MCLKKVRSKKILVDFGCHPMDELGIIIFLHWIFRDNYNFRGIDYLLAHYFAYFSSATIHLQIAFVKYCPGQVDFDSSEWT